MKDGIFYILILAYYFCFPPLPVKNILSLAKLLNKQYIQCSVIWWFFFFWGDNLCQVCPGRAGARIRYQHVHSYRRWRVWREIKIAAVASYLFVVVFGCILKDLPFVVDSNRNGILKFGDFVCVCFFFLISVLFTQHPL